MERENGTVGKICIVPVTINDYEDLYWSYFTWCL